MCTQDYGRKLLALSTAEERVGVGNAFLRKRGRALLTCNAKQELTCFGGRCILAITWSPARRCLVPNRTRSVATSLPTLTLSNTAIAYSNVCLSVAMASFIPKMQSKVAKKTMSHPGIWGREQMGNLGHLPSSLSGVACKSLLALCLHCMA